MLIDNMSTNLHISSNLLLCAKEHALLNFRNKPQFLELNCTTEFISKLVRIWNLATKNLLTRDPYLCLNDPLNDY